MFNKAYSKIQSQFAKAYNAIDVDKPFVPPDEWVSIHDTNLRAGSTTVELNFGTSTGDRTIDWGDGTVEIVNTALPSHTYATDGIYTVTVSGGVTTRLGQRGATVNAGWTQTLTEVVSWGTLGWTSFQEAFRSCVQNFKVPNYLPSTVTSLSNLFINAASFNQPIGNWDTSNITSMGAMFSGASAFNQPIGNWDVSNVDFMSSMFTNAASFNQDISLWNTSNVFTMFAMFQNASAFQGSLHTWDFAKVINLVNFMAVKTGGNSYNTTNYNLLLQRWDNQVTNDAMSTSITANMGGAIFSGEGEGARVSLIDSGWSITDGGGAWVSVHDTSLRSGSTEVELNFGTSTGNRTIDWGDGTVEVVNTSLPSHTYATDGIYTVTVSGGVTTRLGQRGTSPNAGWTQTLIEVVSWGTLGWTNFSQAFRSCTQNFKVPNYLPSTVNNMFVMFLGATAFNQPIGNWDTSSVINMQSVFNGASAFNQPIGDWNTSNVINMSSMFQGAAVFNQPIGSWNTSNVTNMSSMFRDASAFNQPIGDWDTSNVTTMDRLFDSATAFQQPLHTWDFAKVTNLANFMVNKAGANSYNTTNYNLLLQRWDDQVTNDAMSTSITTNMGGAQHSGAGTTSRGNLVTAGWSITDGGAA